jgi:hypothetical protein
MKGKSMSKWSGYLRVKPITQMALDMVAVEIISQTGQKKVSADMALWALINKCRPDIVARATRQAKEEGESVEKPIDWDFPTDD